MKDTKGRCLFNKAEHVEALGVAGPQEVTRKADFDCCPKEVARRQHTDEREIFLGRSLVCREGGDWW